MSGVTRFEDLVAWQRARDLTKTIYRVSLRGEFSRDFGLARQIQRASVSIMSNVAEGFERGRPREFHQFLSTAKASCAELRSHLYVALDVGYLDAEEFGRLIEKSEEVARILGRLRSSVAHRLKLHALQHPR